MFWSKKAKSSTEGLELAEQCRQEAEDLYRAGTYHCAEAVLAVVLKKFTPELPQSMVQAVSGFGGGSGVGCLCGAVSGATVGIGIVLKDTKQTTRLTRELHTWFKEKYGVTCCKIIREKHKGVCPALTGEVTGKVAEMLSKK